MPRPKKQHLKRRKDGRYACRYKDQWFMAYTEEEALAARERYKQAEKEGKLASLRPITVEQYIALWLPLHKSNVAKRTYNDYANFLDKLLPVIGDKQLAQVTVDDAASVWTKNKWGSASAIKHAKMLYVALFDAAIENDMCSKNPFRAKFAQPPKGSAGSHRALTDEEIRLIMETPNRFQLAALIMLFAGLRRGEVLPLTMDDIDLDAGIIHVTKAVHYNSNQPIVALTKTEAGLRDVPIVSALRPYLQGHKGLIIQNTHGKILSTSSLHWMWNSYMKTLSLTAGHPVSIRAHDLRHTYCMMLRDAGVDMKQAMIWMGHKDETMILRIYDHVTEKRTQTSLDQLEKSLIGRQFGRQTENEE